MSDASLEEMGAEIRRTLGTLHNEGDVIELRISKNGAWGSNYYTNFDKLIKDVVRLEREKHPKYQYYITLNELNPEVRLRRSVLEWGNAAKPTTENADVIRRRFIYVDIDPERASGVSASDAGKEAARHAMERACDFLRAEGFSEPIVADSGNGYWLLWRVDLPIELKKGDKENAAFHKALIRYISANVEHSGVKFDEGVTNAARIVKLFGTTARKGDNSPKQPHRPSRLVTVPKSLEPISIDKLRAIAAKIKKKPSERKPIEAIDVRAYLDEWGLEHTEKEVDKGILFEFKQCPMNDEHTNAAAYAIQFFDGGAAAGCHHDGCKEIGFSGVPGWHMLRARYEQGYVAPLPSEGLVKWWASGDKKQNQKDVAELFVKEYKDRLCYSYELNEWLRYNGAYWEIDVSGGRTALSAFINDLIEIVKTAKVPEFNGADAEAELKRWRTERDKWFGWATKQNNAHAQDGILTNAKDSAYIPLSEFDANDWLLNCKNYTVDLRTGTTLPHNPNDKITRIIPVDYNPKARYDRWDSFLTEVLGRPQYIRFLQKEMGYCLTGSTEEEIITILYGDEAAGKSTFYEPVMLVLGVGDIPGYGHYIGFSTLKHAQGGGNAPREDLLRLRTCRSVMCSEINKDTQFDTALTKKIASGEPIVARGLFARFSIEYLPRFKVILGTNYMPCIPYDDGGTYRRFKVHPFVQKFEGDAIDKKLKDVFKTNEAAKERILAWLVEGCLLWQAEGLNDVPREVERANAAYRRSQNPLSEFLEDFCILDSETRRDDPDTWLENMLDKFNNNAQYYGGDQMQERAFGKYMKAMGFKGGRAREKGTRLQYRFYDGIRLKTNAEIANGYAFYDLADIEERIALEMLERCWVKYSGFVSVCRESGCFALGYKKNIETTHDEKNIESYQNPPFTRHTETNLAEVAQAVRAVMTQWRGTRSDRRQKVKRENFVNIVAATVRRHNPQWVGRDIEGIIDQLSASDAEIQTLLAELTEAAS
jgi:P4 family phage/plasmid primase-like protien